MSGATRPDTTQPAMMRADTTQPDTTQPDTTRADIGLLVVAGLYCIGGLTGMTLAGHGVFGDWSITAGIVAACSGPVLWLGVMAIAFNEKTFSRSMLALASIAILGVAIWSFAVLFDGLANI
jgi:hypothetical protein